MLLAARSSARVCAFVLPFPSNRASLDLSVNSQRSSKLSLGELAHNCASEYEWAQHERIGLESGLEAGEVEAARRPLDESWLIPA